ncbi:hypothetical protein HWQ46_16165 [Shewanella sp. D64]|uniref:hypothetical protein n=1 Tax=unclassified Shewanella TaxID=196818 RepID=UPI0022BA687C|nr:MULTISPECIES: hypothetical protein [unclassified Shewanella]MEC4727083.1 hypothetical protein [Shewanella sp. D64]MEC4737822.1 hypothetical protein [Shewanella sp. E94]WBJ93922.1 hypothetical protein HWQ47_18590 [Shewanella sp. MTB7]
MTIKKIDPTTLDFLLKLRRAKQIDTLETMTEALERQNPLASDQEAIALAWVLREKEIKTGISSI